MFDITRRGSFRSLLGASVVAAALTLSAGIANAGECPANQAAAGALGAGATAPVDVTDKVLGSIDLPQKAPSAARYGIKGRAEGTQAEPRQRVLNV